MYHVTNSQRWSDVGMLSGKALALLLYLLFLNKKIKKINTFSIINRIKNFFGGNIVIYETRGQVILPEG